MTMQDRQIEEVARLFSVLGEPSRMRIIRALWEAPRSVNELVEATDLSQPNVSRQLRILRDAGILERRKQGVTAHYAIALPLIRELCDLVCAGAREIAERRVASLGGPDA